MPFMKRIRRRISQGTRRRRHFLRRAEEHEPKANEEVLPAPRSSAIEDGTGDVKYTAPVVQKPPTVVAVHALPDGRVSPISVADASFFISQQHPESKAGSSCSPREARAVMDSPSSSLGNEKAIVNYTSQELFEADQDDVSHVPTIEQNLDVTIPVFLDKHKTKDDSIHTSEIQSFHAVDRKATEANSRSGYILPTRQLVERCTGTVLDFQNSPTEGGDDLKNENVPATNSPTTKEPFLQYRRRVFIEKGGNKNKQGTIVGKQNKSTFKVLLDDGNQVNVRETSVRFWEPASNFQSPSIKTQSTRRKKTKNDEINTGTRATNKRSSTQSSFKNGDRVFIEKGLNKNKTGTILERRNKSTFRVKLDKEDTIVGVRETSVRRLLPSIESSTQNEHDNVPYDGAHPSSTASRQETTGTTKVSLKISGEHFMSKDGLKVGDTKLEYAKSQSLSHDAIKPSLLKPPARVLGRHVRIYKGKYKGQTARIIAMKNRRTYSLALEASGVEVCVLTTSIEPVDCDSPLFDRPKLPTRLSNASSGRTMMSKVRRALLLTPTGTMVRSKRVRRARGDLPDWAPVSVETE